MTKRAPPAVPSRAGPGAPIINPRTRNPTVGSCIDVNRVVPRGVPQNAPGPRPSPGGFRGGRGGPPRGGSPRDRGGAPGPDYRTRSPSLGTLQDNRPTRSNTNVIVPRESRVSQWV